MKKGIIFLVLLGLVLLGLWFYGSSTPYTRAPEKDLVDTTKQIQEGLFGRELKLKIGSKAEYLDGLNIELVGISDSRCKPDVVCVWQGKLQAGLKASGGKLASPIEIGLGTEINKTVTFDNYTFRLAFATTTEAVIEIIYETPEQLGCYVGGCSGQICSEEENVISTCEWQSEYACYKTAKCERQEDGKCGWTKTEALEMCLDNF